MRFWLMLLAVLAVMSGTALFWSRCSLDTWRGGVVLLCKASDPIRVWPLPMIKFYEDPWLQREQVARGPGQVPGPAPTDVLWG